MPRLRATDQQKRVAAVIGVISKYKNLYGITDAEIAQALPGKNGRPMSRKCLCNRKESPQGWKIAELDALMRKLHIPSQELLTALYGEWSVAKKMGVVL